MKRKFFAVFVLLLAVMLVTCDLVEQPVASKADVPKFTDDGRPLVGLSINIGNASISRALTANQATKDAVDYYEVAFKDPNPLGNNHVYRKAFTTAALASGKIYVPQGDYPADTNAILFAGIEGPPHILLAVGNLTGTSDNDPLNPTLITSGTSTVTFTLTSLTNDVNNIKTGAGSSTFKIIGPSAYKTETITDPTIPEINDLPSIIGTYPVFDLPATGFINPTDDFDHSNLPYAGINLMGHYKINIQHSTGMVLQGAWGFQSTGQPYGTDDTGVMVTVTPRYPATAAGTPIDGDFYFRIDVPGSGTGGLSKIYINVPVYAISTQTPDNQNSTIPGTWNIRGGTSNSTLDSGTGSAGGAVLLGVGGHEKPIYTPDWAQVGITPLFP